VAKIAVVGDSVGMQVWGATLNALVAPGPQVFHNHITTPEKDPGYGPGKRMSGAGDFFYCPTAEKMPWLNRDLSVEGFWNSVSEMARRDFKLSPDSKFAWRWFTDGSVNLVPGEQGCRSENPALRLGKCDNSTKGGCSSSELDPWTHMKVNRTSLDYIGVGGADILESKLRVLNASGPHDVVVLQLAQVHNLIHFSSNEYCKLLPRVARMTRDFVHPRTSIILESPTVIRLPFGKSLDKEDMLSTRKQRAFHECGKRSFEWVVNAFSISRPHAYEAQDGTHFDADGNALRALAAVRLHNVRHVMRHAALRRAERDVTPFTEQELIQRRE